MNLSRKHIVVFLISSAIIMAAVINSCRRIHHEELLPEKENSIEANFFNVPATVDPVIKALANKI
jgi:hypothetical protein